MLCVNFFRRGRGLRLLVRVGSCFLAAGSPFAKLDDAPSPSWAPESVIGKSLQYYAPDHSTMPAQHSGAPPLLVHPCQRLASASPPELLLAAAAGKPAAVEWNGPSGHHSAVMCWHGRMVQGIILTDLGPDGRACRTMGLSLGAAELSPGRWFSFTVLGYSASHHLFLFILYAGIPECDRSSPSVVCAR